VLFRLIFLTFLIASVSQAATPGLVATYSSGNHTVTTVTSAPAFDLKPNESIHPTLPPEFSARWDGLIKIIRAGEYRFIGDAKILINRQDVSDKEIKLTEGDHPITIEFTRKPGAARLLLQWQSDHFPLEPVPHSVLFNDAPPVEDEVQQGRLLVQELGCIGCHNAKSESMSARRGPDLTNVGSRISASWIYKWLANPQHFRSAAVMPVVLDKEQDIRDVTSFLASLKDFRRFQEEDYTRRERIARGKELYEKIGCLACHDKDGGSLDGLGSKMTPGALTRYLLDPLRFDPSGRMPSMLLQRDEAAALAAHLVQSRNVEFEKEIPAGDEKRGEQLVKSSGCLNCHTLEIERGRGVTSSLAALELAKVDPANGCMAGATNAPKYLLNPAQKTQISSFINSYKSQPDRSRAPTHAFTENVTRFNCRSCHTLDYSGSKTGFDITPPLTGAGHKLREEYLSSVLNDRQRSRPWIAHRMPDFGPQVRPMVNQIIAASAPIKEDEGPFPSRELIKNGRELMGAGERGLGCVACHTFNGSTVTVLDPARGPEITGMSSRLRREWFYRWVREPNRIHPGTAMPTLFFGKPENEISPVIDSLWAYVTLGRAMQPPPGTDARPSNVLLPDEEPMLMRCVLHGGGKDGKHGRLTRAIAVGFPNLTSYVFDATTGQLAYAWTGGFVDMTAGWSDRGDSSGRRVGRAFFTATGPAIYIGTMDREPQVDFKGYSIDNKIPEFIYTVDGVRVTERITPVEKGIGIVRTFTVGLKDQPIIFTAPNDPSLTVTSDQGAFGHVKGQLILKLDRVSRFSVTITVKDQK
jgi:mono/diheme cytochrome c family protein